MNKNVTGIDSIEWANSYFTNWKLADLFAIQYASRAQTGFQFLTDVLNPDHFLRQEAMSAPVSRQMYILISHNFELLLDAAVCTSSSKDTETDLESEVKVKHQLGSLWGKVTEKDVRKLLQIKQIKPPKENDFFKQFEVHLNNDRIIIVPEFLNVRYDVVDFRGRESTALRTTKIERESMDFAVQTFANISKDIVSYLHSKYPTTVRSVETVE